MLQIDQVSRVFPNGVTALTQVSLRIPVGQRLAIVGPSGAGKSTLLAILGLLDRPTSGSYRVGPDLTENMPESTRTSLRSATFGFIFQSFHLIEHLTAAENVAEALRILGQPQRDAWGSARATLESLGLGHRCDVFPRELSGGEQQRVAIARAIIKQPRVLICDEPTGNLDSANSDLVLDQLLAPNVTRTTILVTHNPEIASRCDRTVHLADGRLVNDFGAVSSIGSDG